MLKITATADYKISREEKISENPQKKKNSGSVTGSIRSLQGTLLFFKSHECLKFYFSKSNTDDGDRLESPEHGSTRAYETIRPASRARRTVRPEYADRHDLVRAIKIKTRTRMTLQLCIRTYCATGKNNSHDRSTSTDVYLRNRRTDDAGRTTHASGRAIEGTTR